LKIKEETKTPNLEYASVGSDQRESDADMYSDVVSDKKVEPTGAEIKQTLDQLLEELNREFANSEEMFKNDNEIPETKYFKDIQDLPENQHMNVFNPTFSLLHFEERISKIDDNQLDLQSKWRKRECLNLIEMLNNTTVQDPHILLRVFNHHQYDPPTFD